MKYDLLEKGGQVLGRIQVTETENVTVTGCFYPAAGFSPLKSLFAMYESAIESLIMTEVVELGERVEQLGLHLSDVHGKPAPLIHNVIIRGASQIFFHVRAPCESLKPNQDAIPSMSGDVFYKLKVHPEAKEDRLVQKGPDRYEVWVREPAEGGRANQAVLALLSKAVGVPAGRLWMIKGAHASAKIVALIARV